MISLSAALHRAWEAGDFAFRPSYPQQNGERHSITITIYWMRKVTNRKERPPMGARQMGYGILDSPNKTLEKALLGKPPRISAVNLDKNTPVVDGDQFTIVADEREMLPDYDILMLQWDIIRMASLCGGAEPEMEEEENDQDDDTGEAASVGKEDF